MPRVSKITDEAKLNILDAYIVNERHGCAGKIKYSDLARYANDIGYTELMEYDFRKCDAVRQRMKEVQSGTASIRGITVLSFYEGMDVTKFVSECKADPLLLSEKIRELDLLCSRFSAEMIRTRNEELRLRHELESSSQEIQMLKSQLALKDEEIKHLNTNSQISGNKMEEFFFLREANRRYDLFVNKYVMPEIVAALLEKKKKQWQMDYSILNLSALPDLLEKGSPGCIPPDSSNDAAEADSKPEEAVPYSDNDPFKRVLNDLANLS